MNQNEHENANRIAIIGMAGRFPGACNIEQFWRNLRDGVESITFFTDDELREVGVEEVLLRDQSYVKAGGVLDDVELFDAALFGMTPREAEITDPQHRLFLECAWEALEHAGYNPKRVAERIAVYAGAGPSSYLVHNLLPRPDVIDAVGEVALFLGNNKDFVPTRVCYKLDLKGPGLNINTACSSSLVCVHLACQALLDYQCDMVLAGGVGIQVPQRHGYTYHAGGINSPDGHCRAFDAGAAGTVTGNGVGIVVLKRLEDALANRDWIHAVILGSAVNNDGAGKAGYTAPSVSGQAEVIAEAHAVANVDAETIRYVEAHGTGTSLGDPIEIAALNEVFVTVKEKRHCAIGSVKTNVGHLDEASGVAGLIKTVKALAARELPPSLHFEHANPQIDFDDGPFYVNDRLKSWPSNGGPLRAGVSSFGIGGTNAHVVVEEAPAVSESSTSRDSQLLLLSAASQPALEIATQDLAAYFREHPDTPLADTAYTLKVGRQTLAHRRAVLCSNRNDAIEVLAKRPAGRVFTGTVPAQEAPVVFMFPGQGSQHANMGRTLYDSEPEFHQHIDHCCELLLPHLGSDLRELIFDSDQAPAQDGAEPDRLLRTDIAQAALFTVEYALAQLWIGWGIRPAAMIGHSIGEYVAACLAGVFSLEQGLALVAQRGRLMHQAPSGTMLAVALSEDELRRRIKTVRNSMGAQHVLAIAAINGARQCVISGDSQSVANIRQRCVAEGVTCQSLRTSHAFHSDLMEPIEKPFMDALRTLRLSAANIPFISNVTGTWIESGDPVRPEYWVKHLRRPVRFADGVRTLGEHLNPIFLEVGPGTTLSTLVEKQLAADQQHAVIPSMRHPFDTQADDVCLLGALGRLWIAGVPVQWEPFYARQRRCRLPLPTYPFERQRFWIDPPVDPSLEPHKPYAKRVEKKSDVAEWFYLPSWQRASTWPRRAVQARSKRNDKLWLLFVDAYGLGDQLAERLEDDGTPVVVIRSGRSLRQVANRAYELNPQSAGEYRVLIDELLQYPSLPSQIVHLWNITPEGSDTERQAMRDLSFYSLLHLGQALIGNRQTGSDSETDGSDSTLLLTVVSNGVCEVTGQERLYPEKSTVLGPLWVLPQEHPELRCRLIDVVLPRDGSSLNRLVEPLLNEVREPPTESIVALRDAHRWHPHYEQIKLEAPVPSESGLRSKGVYLITGAFGGVGRILADYLGRTFQARLALVGRHVPRVEGSGESFDLIRGCSEIDEHEQRIVRELSITPLSAYDGLESGINRLCSAYALDFLKAGGVETNPGRVYSRQQLLERLSVRPEFERLFDYLVDVLSQDGFVQIDAEGIGFIDNPETADAQSARLFTRLLSAYPEFSGTLRLLDHCVTHYGDALSGRIPAIGVLYPEGRSSLLEEAGQQTIQHSRHEVYIHLLRDTIKGFARGTGRKLRILEAGVGDGILARALISELAELDVEYHATDIGRSFLMQAKREAEAAGVRFMKFDMLDITQDPIEQGYAANSFDLVIALDVVHATRDLCESVGHLKKLLAPGGLIGLVETVQAPRWTSMIWGLADGWWHYQDTDLRIKSPLVGLDCWQEVFRRQGFRRVATWPRRDPARSESDCGLVLAQQEHFTCASTGNPASASEAGQRVDSSKDVDPRFASSSMTNHDDSIAQLENMGAEVQVIQADVADERRMREVIAEVEKRFGRIDGVIHAAGATRRELLFNSIVETTREQAAEVFRARVGGIDVLERVLRDRPLDFRLLISSNAATLGGLGLCAYSAACAYMDAFAIDRSRGDQRWISTNWDSWPTEDVAGSEQDFFTGIDRYGMTLEESLAVVERILAHTTGRVVISSGELDHRLDQWIQPHASPPATSVIEVPAKVVNAVGSLQERPENSPTYAPPTTEAENALTQIWQDLLGIDRIGIDDSFFDLGGDSLLGTQLIAHISRALQVDLPFRSLFERPTISLMADQIEKHRSATQLLTMPAGSALTNEEEGEI